LIGTSLGSARGIRGAILGLLLGAALVAPAAAQEKIDLGLFERPTIAALKGCFVRLWQSNRDPDTDRYAVGFYETMAANHDRQPARMLIGDKVVQFRRVALGGKTTGYKIYERQLYKSTTEDYLAILELALEPQEGEAVAIEQGTITLIEPGKLTFVSRVKGGVGCL